MRRLSIRSFVRSTLPRVPYDEILQTTLPSYEISLVFAGRTRATSLNKTLRKKTYTPNVLSYETGTRSGEIIICPDVARRQATSYGMTYRMFLAYLFIHGLLHLKGAVHGTTMEKRERALLARCMA